MLLISVSCFVICLKWLSINCIIHLSLHSPLCIYPLRGMRGAYDGCLGRKLLILTLVIHCDIIPYQHFYVLDYSLILNTDATR